MPDLLSWFRTESLAPIKTLSTLCLRTYVPTTTTLTKQSNRQELFQRATALSTATNAFTILKSTVNAYPWTFMGNSKVVAFAKIANTTLKASTAIDAKPDFIGLTINLGTKPTFANVIYTLQ